jgi:hypothetical protein
MADTLVMSVTGLPPGMVSRIADADNREPCPCQGEIMNR